MQELVCQRFLFRKVDGHSIHHIVVLDAVCRTAERHDFYVLAKLLDNGV